MKGKDRDKAAAPKQGECSEYWDLGPLLKLSPDRILTPGKKDELEAFFLALALVYNDLKTVVLLRETLPSLDGEEQISPRRGQRGGIAFHLARLAGAIVHELLTLIRENARVLQDQRLADILDRIPGPCRERWSDLVECARGAQPESAVLSMIRNNSTFHYYQTKALVRGFEAFFFEDDQIPENQRAYVSVGPDWDATQFYYADAAAQRSLGVLAERQGVEDLNNLVHDYVLKTHFALSALIREFLFIRDPASGVTALRERRR